MRSLRWRTVTNATAGKHNISLIRICTQALDIKMCYILSFPSLPSVCHAAPKHLVNLTMYFICDEITNNPQWGMAHCRAEDCAPYGVFGSYRSKGECPHCIRRVVGGSVLFVCFFPLRGSVWLVMDVEL